MKRLLSVGGTLALMLVLVGGGCTYKYNSSPSDVIPPGDTGPITSTGDIDTDTVRIITLSATADGNRQVTFSWELDEDLEEPEKFLILRSTDEKPVHDGKTYWFRQDGSKRTASWVNLPPGQQHFRICATDDGETCDIYSNDVEVDVVSGPVLQ